MSSWLMSMTRVQRLVVVGEPDPPVQLGIAGQLSVEAGHADEDHAQVAAVEEVAELVQAGVADRLVDRNRLRSSAE